MSPGAGAERPPAEDDHPQAPLPGTARKLSAHQQRLLATWSAVILLALAAGSLQVGQLSILFVACWSVAALAMQDDRESAVCVALAVPAAVKLYPVLLFAAPLLLASGARAAFRRLACYSLALLLVSVAVPMAVWGVAPAVRFELSFFEHALLGSGGRLQTMVDLHSTANQGLDATLMRYLGGGTELHRQHPEVPHLGWPTNVVLWSATAVRGAMLLVTVWFTLRRRAAARGGDRWAVLDVVGLWTAALYLVLPETRARYAVYASLAFVPPMRVAIVRWDSLGRPRRTLVAAALVLTAALVLSFIPQQMRVWGTGLVGAAALWLANLAISWSGTPATARL